MDVLLAQPLRLGAMAEEGRIDLSHVRMLVLDEADKLFDMGFTEQVGLEGRICCMRLPGCNRRWVRCYSKGGAGLLRCVVPLSPCA